MSLLKVEELKVEYDGICALRQVSFSVAENQVVVVLGSNGAGKSSLLRALLGLVPSTCKCMQFMSEDIRNMSTRERVRRGLVLVPETRELFPQMTVEDNLKLGLYLRRQEQEFSERLQEVIDLFPVLGDRLRQLAGTLSGGEQQMLTLARATLQEPALLCLDEPSLGLAPKVVEEVYEMLAEIRNRGVPILLVEQTVHRALSFGMNGILLKVGRIIGRGNCDELREHELIAGSYVQNQIHPTVQSKSDDSMKK